jgi:hypothetical protein
VTFPTTTTAPAPAADSPRRRLPFVALVGAGLIALILLGLLMAAIRSGERPAHTVSAPIDGRSAATLAVVEGIGRVTVHSGGRGGDLYRITTPTGSGDVPTVTQRNGELQLGFAAADRNGTAPPGVDIVLNSAVTWHLRLAGGADSVSLDLRGTSVSELDLASGVSTVEAWLPPPHATLVVRETGGVSQLTLHLSSGAPVRLTVGGGAGSISIDGVSHTGIGAGGQFASDGWGSVTDRLDVDAVGGVSRVRIDRY